MRSRVVSQICPGWQARRIGLILALLTLGNGNAIAQGVDWRPLPLIEMTLFHPGQASLQWVLDPTRHTGATGFRKGGIECLACHLSRSEEMGKKIMQSRELEPAPLLWRREYLKTAVQMHYENERVHLRVRFPLSKLQPPTRMQDEFESRLTVMITDDKVRSAVRPSCWAACHADMRDMPASGGQPTGKYIIDSRSELSMTGGGPKPKSAAELDALLASGTFLEIWQANLNPGQPVVTRDGYILETLHFNQQPAVQAEAALGDGQWTIEFIRSAKAEGPRKPFLVGQSYTLGISLHDQYTAGRYHLVSQKYRFTLLPDGVRFEPLI